MTGADSTEAFEDVGHSEDARHLLNDYLIGTVVRYFLFLYYLFLLIDHDGRRAPWQREHPRRKVQPKQVQIKSVRRPTRANPMTTC